MYTPIRLLFFVLIWIITFFIIKKVKGFATKSIKIKVTLLMVILLIVSYYIPIENSIGFDTPQSVCSYKNWGKKILTTFENDEKNIAVIIFDDNGNVSFDSFYKEKDRWKFNSVVSQHFSFQSVNGNTIITGTADNNDMKYICFIDSMSGLNGTLPIKVSDSRNSKFDQFKLKSYKGSTVYNSAFIKRNNDSYFIIINGEKVKIN